MSLSSPTAPVAPSGLARGAADGKDPFALPHEIRKQSDSVKNLLFGRVGKIKEIEKRRKITFFISAPSSTSASTGMHAYNGCIMSNFYILLPLIC